MPGLGVRTAIKLLTIVGDGSAFPTAAHLAAYAGPAPVTRRSRSSIKGDTPSQRGNHALKSALFLSAFAALADPASRAYYDRKRAAGKRTTQRTDVMKGLRRGSSGSMRTLRTWLVLRRDGRRLSLLAVARGWS